MREAVLVLFRRAGVRERLRRFVKRDQSAAIRGCIRERLFLQAFSDVPLAFCAERVAYGNVNAPATAALDSITLYAFC